MDENGYKKKIRRFHMNLLVSGLITLLFNQLNVVVLLHDQTRQSMINIRKSKI